MMKHMVAYATDFAGETLSTQELYETLKKIADAGFSHIHWCHEWDGDYIYAKAEMLQIRGWMNDLGLKCKGLHATEGSRRMNLQGKFHHRFTKQDRKDYTSENEFNRQAGVELIQNRIEMASILGTDAIVLHMQLPYKDFEADAAFKERYYQQVFKSLDQLEEECRLRGVRICVENLLGTPNHHQVEQFDRLFERYDADHVAFCFDSGHANVTGNDCLELARRYQDRLYMMHLSDNHGLISEECWMHCAEMNKCDEHKNPFNGTFDWDGFAKIVAASPYELPILLEVSKKDRDKAEFLKESLEAGVRFSNMVMQYR